MFIPCKVVHTISFKEQWRSISTKHETINIGVYIGSFIRQRRQTQNSFFTSLGFVVFSKLYCCGDFQYSILCGRII